MSLYNNIMKIRYILCQCQQTRASYFTRDIFTTPERVFVFTLLENTFHAIMLFRPFPQLLFIIVDDVFEYSCEQKQLPRGCFVKMVFLKILQNLQENTCARVSFSIKNTFSYRTSLVTASVWNKIHWKWDIFFRDAYNCE